MSEEEVENPGATAFASFLVAAFSMGAGNWLLSTEFPNEFIDGVAGFVGLTFGGISLLFTVVMIVAAWMMIEEA